MHILIIKTSALGDIIHALPVLDYLHKASPGICIDWIVEEGFKEVLVGNPLLNKLHVLSSRRWKKSLHHFPSSRLRRKLRLSPFTVPHRRDESTLRHTTFTAKDPDGMTASSLFYFNG